MKPLHTSLCFLTSYNLFLCCGLVLCGLTQSGCSRAENPLRNTSQYAKGPQQEGSFHSEAIAAFDSPKHYDPQKLTMTWPLRDPEKHILTRFGTPTIFHSLDQEPRPALQLKQGAGLQSELGGIPFVLAFFHEALDIVRSSATIPEDVYAPVSGYAKVMNVAASHDFNAFNQSHNQGLTHIDHYRTAVVISDSTSGLIVSLLHIKPVETLWEAAELIKVKKGQKIGTLAPLSAMKSEYEAAFRHLHLAVIDPLSMRLLDPQAYTPDYVDTTPPKIERIYFLDEHYATKLKPTSEKLDVVIEVSDRDESNTRNFEVKSIAANLFTSDDRLHWHLPKCLLSDLFDDLQRPAYADTAVANIIDFTNSLQQTSAEKWRGQISTDADNPKRTFRYIVNKLRVDDRGRCATTEVNALGLDKVDFALLQQKRLTPLTLEVVVTDHSDNVTSWKTELSVEKN